MRGRLSLNLNNIVPFWHQNHLFLQALLSRYQRCFSISFSVDYVLLFVLPFVKIGVGHGKSVDYYVEIEGYGLYSADFDSEFSDIAKKLLSTWDFERSASFCTSSFLILNILVGPFLQKHMWGLAKITKINRKYTFLTITIFLGTLALNSAYYPLNPSNFS